MEFGFWEVYWIVVVINAVAAVLMIKAQKKMTAQDVICMCGMTFIPALNVIVLAMGVIGGGIFLIQEGDKIVLWEKEQ